jgi:hypothetical protein
VELALLGKAQATAVVALELEALVLVKVALVEQEKLTLSTGHKEIK